MHISIELVPRSEVHLQQSLTKIQTALPTVNTINIPDLKRMDIRSWEGCRLAQAYYPTTIPHIRAVDTFLDEPLPMADYLRYHNIQEVLVVTGDRLPEQSPDNCPMTSVDLIRRIRQEVPTIQKVYAALDPYRWGFQEEIAYAEQKLEAGADGFFTQPFFDLRLMEIYAEQFSKCNIFWGVAPVMTKKSKRYWEKQNKAIFPADFDCSLIWNRTLAQNALTMARAYQNHIYFMPIRTDVVEYLEGILSC